MVGCILRSYTRTTTYFKRMHYILQKQEQSHFANTASAEKAPSTFSIQRQNGIINMDSNDILAIDRLYEQLHSGTKRQIIVIFVML